MKNFSSIRDLRGLLDEIAKDYPDKAIREIADIIGMGGKSYYLIRAGKEPKAKLLRVLKSFLEKNYNLELEMLGGNKIKLKNINVDHSSTNIITGSNVNQNDDRLKYLLDKNIELERENLRLREELIAYQSKKKK